MFEIDYIYVKAENEKELFFFRSASDIQYLSKKEVRKKKTYSFLHLSLVGLDLGLKFVKHILESLLTLAVLVSLEGKFLKTTVSLAHVLLCVGVAALFVVELVL